MANEADMSGSSSKLVEQAAPSAQFPPLQRNLDQLEALSKKLKSIAATRLLAPEGLNAEQLARDLKSFELKTTFEDAFPAEATSVEEYLQQVHEMAMVSAVQEAQKDNVRSFNDYMMTVLEEGYLQGCWKDELGMAEIVSSKGRLLTTTGIVLDGKIYCSIEETLYMAEVGALHLLHDDICLSLKEIYKMLSQGRYGCCWESFEVYRDLKSLGYIVSRHGVPWTLRHLTKNDSILNEATTKTNLKSDSEYELFKSMHIDKVKPFFDVYAPNSKFRKSSPGNPNFVLCLTSSLPPSKQEISDLERRCNGIPLKLCNVEPGRITFFSFNTVELPILP